jgi:hypothetical protein
MSARKASTAAVAVDSGHSSQESRATQDLGTYLRAIHSYPDTYARKRVSFQRHLLRVMDAAGQGSGGQNGSRSLQ